MGLFKPYCFYSKAAIEYQANGLLRQMEKQGASPRWPFDASLVADFLDLGVVWQPIPSDSNGQIAARILPLQRLIEINEDILDTPVGFQESTLAHEIGHWMLHIDREYLQWECEQRKRKQQLQPDRNPSHARVSTRSYMVATGRGDRSEPFICRAQKQPIPSASIEWQAQFFAACLLMPRQILEQHCQGRDLTKWHHLYAVRDAMGVSISNLVHRLQDLGWIYLPKGSRELQPGALGQPSAMSAMQATIEAGQ